jgi:hypothetical protein
MNENREYKCYIKKPVPVKAYQTEEDITVHTLEGDMFAEKGSYIITGIHGEIYPCRKDIFEESYQEVPSDYYARDILVRCDKCWYNKGLSMANRIMCDNWKTEVDGTGCFYGREE